MDPMHDEYTRIFRMDFIYLFNKLWDCPEKGSSNPGIGSIMSIAGCGGELDCESNAIPVPPITAGSVKLSDWQIREAVRPWEIIGGAHKKGNCKQGSHAEG